MTSQISAHNTTQADPQHIVELRNRYREASEKYAAVSLAIERRRGELQAEMQAKLNSELLSNPTFASVNSLRDERAKAENELHAAVNAHNVEAAKSKLPYPEGAILVEWQWHQSFLPDQLPMRKTGRRSVVQIFKDGDPLPRNAKWSRATPGNVVLRLLKKGGEPGMEVEIWNDWNMKGRWLPEGQEPEQNVKTRAEREAKK